MAKVSSITGDDINAFLLDRGATEECATCGEEELQIVGDQVSTASLILVPNSNPMPADPASFPLAVVACRNCGAIRLHSIGAIATWKKALAAD